MKDPVIKTPMMEEEKRAALALERCTFPFRGFDKRFTANMVHIAGQNGDITDRQRLCLWSLIKRYHRQIKDASLIKTAQERAIGERSLPAKENKQGAPRRKVHRISRVKHKITDFIEMELFNGYPEY